MVLRTAQIGIVIDSMEGRIRKAIAGAQSHHGQAIVCRTEPIISVVALEKQRGSDLFFNTKSLFPLDCDSISPETKLDTKAGTSHEQ
jgi:hypothetical protein